MADKYEHDPQLLKVLRLEQKFELSKLCMIIDQADDIQELRNMLKQVVLQKMAEKNLMLHMLENREKA